MGNIREKPEKTKNTEVFRHKKLTYTLSSMCGWRSFMEDSVMAVYPFCQNEDLGLFGIFDGHGGKSSFIQGLSVRSMLPNIFPSCSRTIKISKPRSTRKP